MTGAPPLSPEMLAAWLPFWQAAGFFLATFILEDAAAVGAGLLLAAGHISWPVAFLACFLGIWMGDAGLYALARWGGRGWFERSSLRKYSGKIAGREKWFARRGTVILIFSRMIPGARLPTYLAAGFLRLPLPRFLLVTGAASAGWTFVILWLAETVGAQLTGWLKEYRHGGFMLIGAAIALFVLLHLLRRVMNRVELRALRARLARWTRWEFWPAWLFYPPVALYCLWLALKYRGLTLPTVANPGIFSGGIVGESKHAMLKELLATSPEFTAEARLVSPGSFAERLQSVEQAIADFTLTATSEAGAPIILKPDLGQRGVGIKLIHTRAQAESYLRATNAPLVAQRYAPGPNEAGIFYYRFPHESRGRIFAITEKIFPKVVGDGRSTLAELIGRDPRAAIIAKTYLARFAPRCNEVLAAGEELKLVEAGNHAQGCVFRDGMHLCTPALESRIDEVSRKLAGFFFGRYDLRYASEDDLRAGRNFQIIELNGAASEATSIYDARNSLWSAYRTLFRQWDLVFAIGAANRARGLAPTPLAPILRAWRHYAQLAASYPAAD
jgi:membrane protein DedA with SNARE-associated domain